MSAVIYQKFDQVPIGKIKPYAKNSRKHSKDQIKRVEKSILEFGFTNPVLVDENFVLIAGHCRLSAAKNLELEDIPTIIIHGLNDNQKKALVIADNKLALDASWDIDVLIQEIEELKDDGYDFELTGFTVDEIADLIPEKINEGLCDEDDVPEIKEESITKIGDVWILGNHRLMCGDSTMIDDVEKLMDGEKADMVFTDPPYGINAMKGDNKTGGGKIAPSNRYENIIGDENNLTAIDSYNLCSGLGIKTLIFWGGNYYSSSLPNSSCWIVWDKNNTGDFADAELAWTNQKTAVRIFKHTWNGLIKDSERGEKRCHPTQKPIALAEWCFDEYGKDAKSVIDLFGGSGSTLIACEKTNRKCFMMELAPNYCDVIVARWEKFTGKKAVLMEQDAYGEESIKKI